jgi:peptidoglycan/xylan/chitin deacetylase (PgdA/CDA1 family)
MLLREFGIDSLKPRGDIDRPMTVGELRELARHPLVHIGNHTRDHAILENYDSTGAKSQIAGAQEDLKEWTGDAPLMIAYPNGNCSAKVIDASRCAGLRLGISIEPRKNLLSATGGVDDDIAMRLGRFTPWGGIDIESQCRVFRSDFSLENWLRARTGSGAAAR